MFFFLCLTKKKKKISKAVSEEHKHKTATKMLEYVRKDGSTDNWLEEIILNKQTAQRDYSVAQRNNHHVTPRIIKLLKDGYCAWVYTSRG